LSFGGWVITRDFGKLLGKTVQRQVLLVVSRRSKLNDELSYWWRGVSQKDKSLIRKSMGCVCHMYELETAKEQPWPGDYITKAFLAGIAAIISNHFPVTM
jgi:hypothetical protein